MRNLLERERIVLENLAAASQRSEIFLVSLTFSVLALSVQFGLPADPGALAEILQAVGWMSLIVSGFSGVQLLSDARRNYYLHLRQMEAKEPTESRAADAALAKDIQRIGSSHWIEKLTRRGYWLGRTQLVSLFIGIVSLAASRLLLLEIFRG